MLPYTVLIDPVRGMRHDLHALKQPAYCSLCSCFRSSAVGFSGQTSYGILRFTSLAIPYVLFLVIIATTSGNPRRPIIGSRRGPGLDPG